MNNNHKATPKPIADDVVISIKNLSKNYRRYASVADGVKEVLHPFRKKYHSEFRALSDISFDIKRGETVGIIGRNGSGKSTLLQIIAGILQPTSGNISVKGRVAALLELGAGFHPLFTGRENVYMAGAIMGFKKDEMDERFNIIADFADIGDFIDQPVRTYSSGMFVRLAFASAINVDPDVLIVDEALAVGDFAFRQKSSEKINQIKKRATVVLVSHSMRDITMLCSKAVVLNNSRLMFYGPADEAVNFYLNMSEPEKKHGGQAGIISSNSGMFGEFFNNTAKIRDVKLEWADAGGNKLRNLDSGAELYLNFSFNLLKPVDELILCVVFHNWEGQLISGISTEHSGLHYSFPEGGSVDGRVKISAVFNPGKYTGIFMVLDRKEFLYRQLAGEFYIKQMSVFAGIITPKHKWEINR